MNATWTCIYKKKKESIRTKKDLYFNVLYLIHMKYI